MSHQFFSETLNDVIKGYSEQELEENLVNAIKEIDLDDLD